MLKICSGDTAARFISLEGLQYPRTQVITCLALFLIRVDFLSVNQKGVLNAQQRVEILWSLFLFSLHVDGIHVTTKRNMLLECVSILFLMYRNDVI